MAHVAKRFPGLPRAETTCPTSPRIALDSGLDYVAHVSPVSFPSYISNAFGGLQQDKEGAADCPPSQDFLP